MRGSVDFQEFAETRSGVDLRCVELLITENRLQVTQVSIIFQHQGRHRMAKNVTSARLSNSSTLDVTACVLGERIGMERFALVGDEERLLLFVQEQSVTPVFA